MGYTRGDAGAGRADAGLAGAAGCWTGWAALKNTETLDARDVQICQCGASANCCWTPHGHLHGWTQGKEDIRPWNPILWHSTKPIQSDFISSSWKEKGAIAPFQAIKDSCSVRVADLPSPAVAWSVLAYPTFGHSPHSHHRAFHPSNPIQSLVQTIQTIHIRSCIRQTSSPPTHTAHAAQRQ